MKQLGYFAARRERDPYTRALSFVVSRGFGTHVRLTLWWWSFGYHRRDRDLEQRLREKAEEGLAMARGENGPL